MNKSSKFQIPSFKSKNKISSSKILFYAFLTWNLELGTWNCLRALTFDDLVAGAQAGGLGGSFVALAEGPQSLYVNPAGLSDLNIPHFYGGFGHYYSVPASNYHFSYLKPMYQGIVIGGGWQGSDSLVKKFDRFYLTWAEQSIFPGIPKEEQRFSWGMSLRALSLRERPGPNDSFDSAVGFGLDAGAKLEFPRSKTQFGASVIGIDSLMSKVQGPALNLGALQRFGAVSGMIDFRMRRELATFYPAVQVELFKGLGFLRAGRGLRLGELRTVSIGFGTAFSPVIIDTALVLPYEGFHRKEGAVMVSVGYALGGRHFYERFVGRAAVQAQELSQRIIALEQNRKKLAKENKDAETDLKVLREEIRALDERKRSDQTERALEEARQEQAQKKAAEEEQALKPKPVAEWPKQHRVIAGDTLRRIAATFYGDPELWELIYKVNSEKIERGLPKIGEVLMIPKPE
ncbi:MAG: LysM peptidoglycan-binding domain-containing protein [Elusimicrobia bacterium]|nr:LysM peptidoglycan-binding domain-containing protein [Elusimicrobiota bacterium]